MDQDKYISLLRKKWQSATTKVEDEHLDSWLSKKENAEDAKQYKKAWDASARYKEGAFQPSTEKALQKFRQRIAEADSAEGIGTTGGKVIPLRRVLSLAATFLLLVVAVLWLVSNLGNDANSEWVTVSTLGQERQVVALPDGSTVTLNEFASLSYPNDLNTQKERQVRFSGESLF